MGNKHRSDNGYNNAIFRQKATVYDDGPKTSANWLYISKTKTDIYRNITPFKKAVICHIALGPHQIDTLVSEFHFSK